MSFLLELEAYPAVQMQSSSTDKEWGGDGMQVLKTHHPYKSATLKPQDIQDQKKNKKGKQNMKTKIIIKCQVHRFVFLQEEEEYERKDEGRSLRGAPVQA